MPDSARTIAHRLTTGLREQFDRHGIDVPGLQVDLAAVVSGVPGVQVGGLGEGAAQRLMDALRRSEPAA